MHSFLINSQSLGETSDTVEAVSSAYFICLTRMFAEFAFRYANTLMVTLNNRAFMHAQASDGDIRRSPLILHMTSRHSDRCTRSNAAEIGTCRPVEVTLPPAADADEYPSEVRGFFDVRAPEH